MRKIILLLLCTQHLPAQNPPVSLRSDVTVQFLANVHAGAARVAKDPVSKDIFYLTTSGTVYCIKNIFSSPYEVTAFTVADHDIDFLQGMLFLDSTLFLVGNHRIDSTLYVGLVKKGVLQPNGTRVWSTVLSTEAYAQSWTWYDHGFSGCTVSPDGAYLFISSGSRTDHGEEQNNYGLYPGMREVPLTSAVFRIPTSALNLYLPNDSAQLAPYLFADGTRNSFDLAFDAGGNLFGTENSGDRDDPDELNWLRQGRHYGFPWKMGGHDNPQQFSNYNPGGDLLLNGQCNCSVKGYYYNDPAFPSCSGYTFTEPVNNLGPDADKFRDPAGHVQDGSSCGSNITSFTPHRCPLGLSFDRQNILASDLQGDGFMVSFTRGGDSTGLDQYGYPATVCDPGQDLLHLDLSPDGSGEFQMQATVIVNNFDYPVDTYLDSNILYVLEYAYSGSGRLFAITLPLSAASVPEVENEHAIHVYPNPAAEMITIDVGDESGDERACLRDMLGQEIDRMTMLKKGSYSVAHLPRGIYFLEIHTGSGTMMQKIVLQ